ncbi:MULTISPECIES: hypothetical protein [unclassified Bradyrhizobium]|uniref:hypothetical protein n=1 Tax=unclassified Bradyrhizobium TaxID=2631580 RepID=UPI002915DC45|nr:MULTISPECIES: hypothetical protein [unclassified Bradyrhizobium]
MKIVLPRVSESAELRNGGLKSDPAHRPDLATHAASTRLRRVINDQFRDACKKFDQGAYPWLLIENFFDPGELPETPTTIEPAENDESWWSGAYAALAAIDAIRHRPVSYRCENSGHLFVHLTGLPGEGRLAEKSRAKMRGHTDACSFPFPSEFKDGDTISPSPDVVILIGYRNPDGIPTHLAPLASIADKLTPAEIAELGKPHFSIGSQNTFKTDHILVDAPIMSFDSARGGWSIRFSHKKCTADPDIPAAVKALEALKEAASASFEAIVVNPGSVFLINNRSALHGRAEVGGEIGGKSRWLMRTYANRADTPAYVEDPDRPFLLSP